MRGIIKTALKASCKFHQNRSHIKYENALDMRGTCLCNPGECELIALYLPELKDKLGRLVERDNKRRANLIKPNVAPFSPTTNMRCEPC